MQIAQSELTQITQFSKINDLVKTVPKHALSVLCPALYDLLLQKSENHLKNMIGQYIFHLKQNDNLDTIVGLQKLLEGSLTIIPEETLQCLEENCNEGKELAEGIRRILV